MLDLRQIQRNGAGERQADAVPRHDAALRTPFEFLHGSENIPKSSSSPALYTQVIPEAVGYNLDVLDQIRCALDDGWHRWVVEHSHHRLHAAPRCQPRVFLTL